MYLSLLMELKEALLLLLVTYGNFVEVITRIFPR